MNRSFLLPKISVVFTPYPFNYKILSIKPVDKKNIYHLSIDIIYHSILLSFLTIALWAHHITSGMRTQLKYLK